MEYAVPRPTLASNPLNESGFCNLSRGIKGQSVFRDDHNKEESAETLFVFFPVVALTSLQIG